MEEEPYQDVEMENFPSELDMYLGMHNFMAPQAKQLVTHHDLTNYKSCIDLGGMGSYMNTNG